MNEHKIFYKITGAAIEIHKNICPGLRESTYANDLAFKASMALSKSDKFINSIN